MDYELVDINEVARHVTIKRKRGTPRHSTTYRWYRREEQKAEKRAKKLATLHARKVANA